MAGDTAPQPEPEIHARPGMQKRVVTRLLRRQGRPAGELLHHGAEVGRVGVENRRRSSPGSSGPSAHRRLRNPALGAQPAAKRVRCGRGSHGGGDHRGVGNPAVAAEKIGQGVLTRRR
ncbi:unnamed protein product [Cuscuta epithymum]|uniref:Uncharacterized protein n=1 Tax=Cuscuta epithymum TaxID=186058 RepID=A0AAV0EKQ0_9ASTE|nr:unnamed protein product [Cuscuta epithymum]CAH9123104.1 unnamed protein product [Cuscuta epithymum]